MFGPKYSICENHYIASLSKEKKDKVMGTTLIFMVCSGE